MAALGGSIQLKTISDAGDRPTKTVIPVADLTTGEATANTTPTPTDHVYEQGKVPDKQSTVNYATGGDPPGTTYDYVLDREYVYGLEYIDGEPRRAETNGSGPPPLK